MQPLLDAFRGASTVDELRQLVQAARTLKQSLADASLHRAMIEAETRVARTVETGGKRAPKQGPLAKGPSVGKGKDSALCQAHVQGRCHKGAGCRWQHPARPKPRGQQQQKPVALVAVAPGNSALPPLPSQAALPPPQPQQQPAQPQQQQQPAHNPQQQQPLAQKPPQQHPLAKNPQQQQQPLAQMPQQEQQQPLAPKPQQQQEPLAPKPQQQHPQPQLVPLPPPPPPPVPQQKPQPSQLPEPKQKKPQVVLQREFVEDID